MRILTTFALITGLAACQPTPAPSQQEPVDLGAAVTSVTASVNALKGQPLGQSMVRDGATGSGRTITEYILVRDTMAQTMRSRPISEFAGPTETLLRDGFCHDANKRSFIAAGGNMVVVFRDQARQQLFSINIDRC